MGERWKLKVENFGKIEKAEIEVSPLMIFLGDNNSGKSYMMSLLWGLINKSYNLLTNGNNYEFDTYKKCAEWLDLISNKREITIDRKVRKLLQEWVNEILLNNKETLVSTILNRDSNIETMEIEFLDDKDIEIDYNVIDKEIYVYADQAFSSGGKDEIKDEHTFLANICYYLLFNDFKKQSTSEAEPLFLPASRTGFTLTYKTLINESLKSNFGYKRGDDSKFTMPIINFLNRFVSLDVESNKKYSEVVRFIEDELIRGSIIKDQSPVKNIYYKPENLNEELPLYLTSSLVTEVTPLILFLSDLNSSFKTVVMEEPEAHLHLKAQIVMARAVAMLINSGTNVWLTTHSDTFMQQINNLIKLQAHPDKNELLKEFGFTNSETLDVNSIKVYEFNIENGKTMVKALKGGINGFPVQTFNEVLYKLTEEVLALEEDYD